MNIGPAASANQTIRTSTAGQFLTFRLEAEEYAIDILKVQEIKGYSAITPIPNAPHYIKGVINLRGTVVPVVGLRERFGMPSVPYDRFTVIILVTVGTKVVGMVVDAVSDVLVLRDEDIEAPPDFGGSVDTSFMRGLAKVGERLVLALDIERAVGDSDLARVDGD
jgi:purine-binding chemotaxis protein CheW